MPRKASASVKTVSARKRALRPEVRIPIPELQQLSHEWLLDCELRQHTQRTLDSRRNHLKKFFWFLNHRQISDVGTPELRQYMHYLANGHLEPGGRWGNPQITEPMRPVSMHGHYRVLRALFNWMVKEDAIEFSPFARVPAPIFRSEIKQPLPIEQTTKLIQAAKRSLNPRRDEAIVLLLLDTGIRASELRGLKVEDFDFDRRPCRVLGKGQKYRTVYYGAATARALSRYLRKEQRRPSDPVFVGNSGTRKGEGLLASSLFHILERLAIAAGIDRKLCAPHALRRAFAVNMLRNGANAFAVQVMMGHSDMETTRRYVALAEADVERQHQAFSPVDRLSRS